MPVQLMPVIVCNRMFRGMSDIGTEGFWRC